jgi:hypothetical protein
MSNPPRYRKRGFETRIDIEAVAAPEGANEDRHAAWRKSAALAAIDFYP